MHDQRPISVARASLANGKTARHYFRIWSKQGIWEPIMVHLRKRVRTQMEREPEPSAAIHR